MQKTIVLDPYATTEKNITIFEHLPQDTGYNFLEQKIEVTANDDFLELLIKECSRYEIVYEQQGNTIIMVLAVWEEMAPIHMVLISKAKEAYMKSVYKL